MSDILKGVVKWFNDAKGFGFIQHASGKDVFVHYSVIMSEGFKTLKDGEEVQYEVSEGPKGLHASKVLRLIQPQATASQLVYEVTIETSSTAGQTDGFPVAPEAIAASLTAKQA